MKNVLIIVVALMVLYTPDFFAQQADTDDPEYCLAEGIHSSDKQIRKESLFTLYDENQKEALPVLIDRLDKEEEPDLKIMLARIIHKFGELKGIKALERTAWNDDNIKLRYICKALCEDYAKNHPMDYSLDLDKLNDSIASAESN